MTKTSSWSLVLMTDFEPGDLVRSVMTCHSSRGRPCALFTVVQSEDTVIAGGVKQVWVEAGVLGLVMRVDTHAHGDVCSARVIVRLFWDEPCDVVVDTRHGSIERV